MGKHNPLVEKYESTRRAAQGVSTWKLKVWLNYARLRLKRTGREIDRIQVFVLENELQHRPLQSVLGQRSSVRS